MRYCAVVLILIGIFSGCSRGSAVATDGEPVPPEILKAMEGVAGKQSQGLDKAQTIVHHVYDYSGYTWAKPADGAKSVAVDVEFRGYNHGLDLDDVDIIDGESNENYGSGPHIANLTLDGKLAPDTDDASWPKDLGPLRVLLIYAVPKSTRTIKLGYWGEELTPKQIPISGEGPTLPEPK